MQASTIRRSFHLQLLPIEIQAHQVLNVEIVQHSDGYQQNLMSLGAEVQLPELCEAQDVSIAVLEGTGNLVINDEQVQLEPGMFVFIPAMTHHTLKADSKLIFFLNRCHPDPMLASPWIINL
ncbi:cupin domain-containing protein [Leptolyngbya sp. NIES-2104]|uniref:cupin domain-containing protein n=1 Tax=Leptolyngbya sp. NIES-2104 TaxID=1552121 RepID=UPI0006EC9C1B|nr:cupin domain-containing protein [Leptolyngbya sp. NIES-2104]GAP94743.1 hypothetical protein NIES2104_12600 [Leptolyngbya sp. NIES-2104]